MTDTPEPKPSKGKDKDRDRDRDRDGDFAERISAGAERKLHARRQGAGLWSGLGMMGVIGWSVVLPTLLGAAAGLWLDKHYPGGRSWTLALLIAGLVLGCFNAWHWVDMEERSMRAEQNRDKKKDMHE